MVLERGLLNLEAIVDCVLKCSSVFNQRHLPFPTHPYHRKAVSSSGRIPERKKRKLYSDYYYIPKPEVCFWILYFHKRMNHTEGVEWVVTKMIRGWTYPLIWECVDWTESDVTERLTQSTDWTNTGSLKTWRL